MQHMFARIELAVVVLVLVCNPAVFPVRVAAPLIMAAEPIVIARLADDDDGFLGNCMIASFYQCAVEIAGCNSYF